MFGNQPAPVEPQEDLSNLVKDLMRRVRVLEERYSSLRKNNQVNEQNMLQWNRKVMTEVKAVNMDLQEMKKSMRAIKDNMMLIVKELRQTVKKEEVKVLEKYIQLWEPLNYVTHNELDQIMKKQ